MATKTQTTTDTSRGQMAHLLRRAGFGATPDELDQAMEAGYDVTVEELLDPGPPDVLPEDLIRRYHIDQSELRGSGAAGSYWVYRMVMTSSPLREKICLFWHRVFATAATKLIQSRPLMNQIEMFRQYGMGSLRDLLVQLSRDPAMIMWLDNQDNHKGSINENYGREILELFSMGVGSYTEDDIKECARAFTGWRVVNPDYMSIKMRNNTARPFGYMSWQFEYDDDDHDHGQKTFLGETGDFNGEDAVDIICKQEATARFISRHLYHYFVADEEPVPQWPHTLPRDPEAIDVMTAAYFDSGYSIEAMLRAMFNSDFFKSEASHFARTKSPAEMVVGAMRLAGGLEIPSSETYAAAGACGGMGQGLLAPSQRRGVAGRQRVDQHRGLRAAPQLRRQDAQRSQQAGREGCHRPRRPVGARLYALAGRAGRLVPGGAGADEGAGLDPQQPHRLRGEVRPPALLRSAGGVQDRRGYRCRHPADRLHAGVPAGVGAAAPTGRLTI